MIWGFFLDSILRGTILSDHLKIHARKNTLKNENVGAKYN